VNSLTAPFDIEDDGSIVVQTSIAIGTSNAMIDIVDSIPASAGANEELKLAHVDAIRTFLTIQRLPGENIDLNTGNFDNNLSSADDTTQKALDTLDDLDLTNIFHFDEADEFTGVSQAGLKVTDHMIFEDAGNSWEKRWCTVQQLVNIVTPASHTHSDAIHSDVAGEIYGIATVAPAVADVIVLEDATDNWNKKSSTLETLINDVIIPSGDHGSLLGLGDDDHALYLLASDATDRSTFATNWLDLTDAGETSLHIHDDRYYTETEADALLDPLQNFFNGTFVESFNALVTEDAGNVVLSLEQSGGGDLTMRFSDGDTTLDCTGPVQTINLTAGTDAAPQANYIYVPQSTKVLTKHTSQWPSAEHIKIGYFLVPSSAYVASDGVYINQNWNDHRMGTDSQGHLPHLCETIRLTMHGATWNSGVAGNAAGSEYLEITGTAPSVVEFKSTAGVVYQMHRHTVPAIDMSGTDICHVVNWNGDAYHDVADLADIVADSAGVSLSNKHFNLVFWGVANKTGEYSPLMCNLPNGSYSTQTGAELDLDNFTVTTIPDEFTNESSTGFLICRLTVHQNPSGTWTLNATEDLRGVIPGAGTGAAGAGGALTDFPDNQFTLYDSDDNTRVLSFDLSSITTGNTRTITPADADMTLLSTTDYTDLTDSGATTLHKHDHDAMDNFVANEHIDWTGASAGTIHTDNYIEGGAGTDTTAIHDNVASEIHALTLLSAPSGYDKLIIEDADDSWNKKTIEVGDIGTFCGGSYDESTSTDVVAIADNKSSLKIAVGTITVENNTGSSLSKGDICYISGDDTGVPEVTLADADAAATAIGELVVIAETITTGNSGAAKREGLITGLSGFTANTVQYLSTTAGDTTETVPSGSGDIVRVLGYSRITTELMFAPSNSWVEVA
jgi:hypothetical protein